jgi:voltage-gated potassium channel
VSSVAAFTLEYVLRLAACTADTRYRHPVAGRIRYALTPLLLLDLLSFLPCYFAGVAVDLRFVRVLRLVRTVRTGKLARYSRALRTLGQVIAAKREELVVSVSLVLLVLFVAACLMYTAEGHVQPEAFPSIPAALWWTVVTLTSIGYGDVYPITPLGKGIAGCIAVLGMGLVALPTGILASGFIEQIQCARETPGQCPHCGKGL